MNNLSSYKWLAKTRLKRIESKIAREAASKAQNTSNTQYTSYTRVSVQGVESLWGDCRFIPADWGS